METREERDEGERPLCVTASCQDLIPSLRTEQRKKKKRSTSSDGGAAVRTQREQPANTRIIFRVSGAPAEIYYWSHS